MKQFDEKARREALNKIACISNGDPGTSYVEHALGDCTFTSLDDLLGKTIIDISGAEEGNDFILFECSDGSKYLMLHFKDCCESVDINDICGDIDRLIGHPILQAQETTHDGQDDYHDSFTWTFYNLGTVKGYVTIKWYGTSNGYYSERVDFVRIK